MALPGDWSWAQTFDENRTSQEDTEVLSLMILASFVTQVGQLGFSNLTFGQVHHPVVIP